MGLQENTTPFPFDHPFAILRHPATPRRSRECGRVLGECSIRDWPRPAQEDPPGTARKHTSPSGRINIVGHPARAWHRDCYVDQAHLAPASPTIPFRYSTADV